MMDEADRWVCRGCRTAFWQDTPAEQTDHGLFCRWCCDSLGYTIEVVEPRVVRRYKEIAGVAA